MSEVAVTTKAVCKCYACKQHAWPPFVCEECGKHLGMINVCSCDD